MFVISAMLAGVLSLIIVFGPFLIPDYIRKLKNRKREKVACRLGKYRNHSEP